MNQRSWLTFVVAGLLLLIKLVVVSIQQLDTLDAVYGVKNLSLANLFIAFKYHHFLIEPALLILALGGFAVRRRVGFLSSILFSYFTVTYWVIQSFPEIKFPSGHSTGQLVFAILVLFLLNLKTSKNYFLLNTAIEPDWKINFLALSIALVLNGYLVSLPYFD